MHVHISLTKCCIVGYLSDALWDLWDGSIAINGSGNGMLFVKWQTITWTNADLLLVRSSESSLYSEMFKIFASSFRELHLKMPSAEGSYFFFSCQCDKSLIFVVYIILHSRSVPMIYQAE